jgi:DNA polymerase-1
VPNEETVDTEGKKTSKYRTIKLCSIVEDLKIDVFTPSGWPSVSGDVLRSLAGKIPTEHIYTIDDSDEDSSGSEDPEQEIDENSSYGTAYEAFGGGKQGKAACHAIAALCEICSIDSLISNFILPLQVSQLIL